MPPKRGAATLTNGRLSHTPRKGGYARDAYETITSPENRSVVTSIAFFAASVAFLHSSWGEVLMPAF